MFKSIKSSAICLVVNSVLRSGKGTLDFSYDSELYKKYGIKDNSNTTKPFGVFSVSSLEPFLVNLKETDTCSEWAKIHTFKFNNQALDIDHIPYILSVLKIVPTFRPSVFELKGTDVAVISELAPIIQMMYSGNTKPKIVFLNAPPSGGHRKCRKTRKQTKNAKSIYRCKKNRTRK